MRLTVTLEKDVEQIVRRRMRAQKVSFERALDDAIRDGARGRPLVEFRTETASMGAPPVNLDRAPRFAAELEDALVERSRPSA